MEETNKVCVKCECNECHTKFEIWLNQQNPDLETEEKIKKNIHLHCPVCKGIE